MNKLKSVYIIFAWLAIIVNIINSVIQYSSHEYTAAIYWLLWSFFVYKIAFRITEDHDEQTR